MKTTPMLFNTEMVNALLDGRKTQTRRILSPQPEMGIQRAICGYLNGNGNLLICKHGSVGDLIYVRETFFDNLMPRTDEQRLSREEVYYRADGTPDFEGEEDSMQWKPSIHMPRWASRLTLKITSVRVEQLQNISEKDALAEGVDTMKDAAEKGVSWCSGPKTAFRLLWQSAYSPESWDANPWVWVIEFEVIKSNVDVILKKMAA